MVLTDEGVPAVELRRAIAAVRANEVAGNVPAMTPTERRTAAVELVLTCQALGIVR